MNARSKLLVTIRRLFARETACRNLAFAVEHSAPNYHGQSRGFSESIRELVETFKVTDDEYDHALEAGDYDREFGAMGLMARRAFCQL